MIRSGYVAGRLVKAAAVVLAIVVLNFVLIRLAPGDPVAVMAGEQGQADAAFMAEMRAQFGLDRPLPVQLGIYVGEVLTLNLGTSYRQGRPVWDVIAERLPATLLLTGAAFALALGLGVALGVLAARHAGRWPDAVIGLFALTFFATPLFWVGLLAVMLFSSALGWLPAYGMETVGAGHAGLARVADVAVHLLLPALTLGLYHMATYVRLTRAAVLEVLPLEFVRAGHAKGLTGRAVWRRHVVPNALLPVLTMAGLQAGQLAGGAVLTETVFAWPGIGRLAFDALLQRDYPLLLGVFLVASVLVVVINLATDLCYGLVDPRIEVAS